jgi:hypothetical protein
MSGVFGPIPCTQATEANPIARQPSRHPSAFTLPYVVLLSSHSVRKTVDSDYHTRNVGSNKRFGMVHIDQRALKRSIRAGTEWEALSLIKNKETIIAVCDVTLYVPDYTVWRHRTELC